MICYSCQREMHWIITINKDGETIKKGWCPECGTRREEILFIPKEKNDLPTEK